MVNKNAQASAGDLMVPGDPGALTRPQDDFLLLPKIGLIHKRTFWVMLKVGLSASLISFLSGIILLFIANPNNWVWFTLLYLSNLAISITATVMLITAIILTSLVHYKFKHRHSHE